MIKDILTKQISEAVEKLFDKKVIFDMSWDGKFADYASNIAMVLGEGNSRETAEKIKEELSASKDFGEYVSKIEIAGPGFLNFWLTEKAFEEGLKFALKDKFAGAQGKAQVEFISANPTGPLTIGNGRGGVCGDVLGNVLEKVGYEVTKEYYINDAGNQIDTLGHSILKDEEAKYAGEYIDELAEKLLDDNKAKDARALGKEAVKIILEGIKKTVADMGTEMDVWFSETEELRKKGKVEEVINWLKEKNLAYEKEGALWFKASEFGDREDRVLIKTDGEPTYFGVDCAYHKNKFVERGFDRVINIWGADHHGDVPRVKGFIDVLGYKENFEIILMQLVRLIKDGKPARMSKREGVYVLIDDILKEVGKDAFRYFMIARSSDTHIDFDLDLAKEQSKKNPVYYVQYAGARMSSILEKTGIENIEPKISDIKLLDSKYEKALILKMIQLPEIIENTAKDYQVQRLATYIYELAKTFTDFYENVRVSDVESEEIKTARLELVAVSRKILESVLGLLGISAPEKM